MSREKANKITHETLDRYLSFDMTQPIHYTELPNKVVWPTDINQDEFVKEFLELEKTATGPTVKEFLELYPWTIKQTNVP